MMFLLHLALLLYGLAAMLVAKLRTTSGADMSQPGMWDTADSKFYELVDQFFPESIFQPYQPGVAELVHQPGRAYLIGGGLVAYSLRYLLTRHRG